MALCEDVGERKMRFSFDRVGEESEHRARDGSWRWSTSRNQSLVSLLFFRRKNRKARKREMAKRRREEKNAKQKKNQKKEECARVQEKNT